ncbi:hypothetical protein GDO81_000495 [Engystomops pustulosus]|uniref:Uncharacterized protein n=1 Tax=Engystomops pustulosus TaxID=76066 RepID=A0AAV7D4U3_ENGPU|nr:hypothetical protein GDO81_000495 [Engystomops pustulosus]
MAGSTTFRENNCKQPLPVTINEFLTRLCGNFTPFFSKLLRALHRRSMGFRSGLIAATLQVYSAISDY